MKSRRTTIILTFITIYLTAGLLYLARISDDEEVYHRNQMNATGAAFAMFAWPALAASDLAHLIRVLTGTYR